MKHYAGKVKYTVKGWVERNMDRVPPSFHDTFQRSAHKVQTNIFVSRQDTAKMPIVRCSFHQSQEV